MAQEVFRNKRVCSRPVRMKTHENVKNVWTLVRKDRRLDMRIIVDGLNIVKKWRDKL